ncbi:MAG TPA: hypothetical protein VE262_11240 [Blastocatellia bacterium]|nr:hypothetical protein [Blastocatellia bacterium]
MSVEIIAAIAIAAGLGLLLLWRTVRFFIRLLIFGLIVLLALGLFAWGYGVDNPFGQGDDQPAKTRRGSGR